MYPISAVDFPIPSPQRVVMFVLRQMFSDNLPIEKPICSVFLFPYICHISHESKYMGMLPHILDEGETPILCLRETPRIAPWRGSPYGHREHDARKSRDIMGPPFLANVGSNSWFIIPITRIYGAYIYIYLSIYLSLYNTYVYIYI